MAREFGSVAFGLDAQGYHQARLPYPNALYDELFSRLPPHPLILELGAGTGLVTQALLERDPKGVVAVEPDPALVRFTRERLADSRLTMISGAFPEADVAGPFDLIACAAAFHWMEPSAALARARELLRPGGIWAMWWHSYWNPKFGDPLADEVSPLLEDIALPPSMSGSHHYSLDVELQSSLLTKAGFHSVAHRLYRCERMLTTKQVLALYETYSFVRLLPPDGKNQFLGRLAKLVDEHFGGSAPNLVLTALYFGFA